MSHCWEEITESGSDWGYRSHVNKCKELLIFKWSIFFFSNTCRNLRCVIEGFFSIFQYFFSLLSPII